MANRQSKSKPTWANVKAKLAGFDRTALLSLVQNGLGPFGGGGEPKSVIDSKRRRLECLRPAGDMGALPREAERQGKQEHRRFA